ncbi:MAG: hypothetical protein O7I93_12390 [Gemmatimonadetes bacterium]|nr:hypothetical protein [Gemmatimonadota bacterium]
MIDIHSHLIPAFDDGSRSVEQSGTVLRMFEQHGVQHVVLTPHVLASELATSTEEMVRRRDAAFAPLERLAVVTPRLHLGFEIMLDQPMAADVIGDRRVSLAGSRYYLVEFPYTVAPQFAQAVLSDLVRARTVPIVAHPERYEACSPRAVAAWRDAGARIQLDATTLTRVTDRGHRARELLASGLADVIAADNHGNQRSVKTGVEYLEKRGAGAQAELLAVANPRAVLEDQPMTAVPPVSLKEGLVNRWKRFLTG